MNAKSSMNSASKKHRRDSENESDDNDEIDPSEFAQMTRSQRKCHRERRRRSEVNKGFDDLTSLLWDIDATTMRTEVENRAQRGKKQCNLPTEDILLSRVDLINFTISLLRRLHGENEQRKEIITTLTRAGTGTLDAGVNLTLPNLGNVTATHDTDRARLAATERLLLGMISPSSSAFLGGPRSLPAPTLDSQHLFHQQSLLDQLVRTQPNNSGVLTRSIQDVLTNIYPPQNLPSQSDASSNRKETDGLSTVHTRIPSAVVDGGSGIASSNDSASLRGPSNSDVVAKFLARQQNNRNISKYLNNNNNNLSNNAAVEESAALSLRNALPIPASVAPTDTTRQLLQLMQNRQRNLSNNANLAQIEALLQQQLQQKPPGR